MLNQSQQHQSARVRVGGCKIAVFPLQPMVTTETLYNIYTKERFSQSVIDAYNQYTSEINNATWHETKNILLDQRHRFYIEQMKNSVGVQ